MKISEMIKSYVKTTCISYTLVSLFQATMAIFYLSPKMNNEIVLNIFLVCLFINLVIHITNYLKINETLKDILSIMEIIITVVLVNYFLGYNVSLLNIIIIGIVSTIIYFVCCFVAYVQNSNDAQLINEKIKRNRKGN